jgi:hypothetical protein
MPSRHSSFIIISIDFMAGGTLVLLASAHVSWRHRIFVGFIFWTSKVIMTTPTKETDFASFS